MERDRGRPQRQPLDHDAGKLEFQPDRNDLLLFLLPGLLRRGGRKGGGPLAGTEGHRENHHGRSQEDEAHPSGRAEGTEAAGRGGGGLPRGLFPVHGPAHAVEFHLLEPAVGALGDMEFHLVHVLGVQAAIEGPEQGRTDLLVRHASSIPHFPSPGPFVRRTLPDVKILRQFLGVLSLALGFVLLGECAIHTSRELAAVRPTGGPSALLLREAFFAPGHHGPAYQWLLALGAALLILGTFLTRAWALPFFVFGAACLALFGGMVVERTLDPKGAQVLLLQDGILGIWDVLQAEDALVVLWMGIAALIPGLFLSHGFGKKAVPKTPPGRTPPA